MASAIAPRRRSDPTRSWPTIVRLALSASTRDALRGLGWLMRGKRVRGWNVLHRAASLHRNYYRSWIAKAEPSIIQRFCTERTAGNQSVRIGCLILASGSAHALETLKSVRLGLGAATPVWTNIAALADQGAQVIGSDLTLGEALAQIAVGADWILPLPAGDIVARSLGAVLARATFDGSESPAVFWDEDRWSNGRRNRPWIKPDWDALLFARDSGGVVGAGLIALPVTQGAAEAQQASFDLAGIDGLVRQALAADCRTPVHLPLVLTHRGDSFRPGDSVREPDRAVPPSRTGSSPAVSRWPAVSIIIPVRDRADLLRSCLVGLRSLNYPGHVDIVIVDNDSVEADIHRLFAALECEAGVTVIPYPGAFNFAEMINHAAANTSGDILCLLNNDVEPLDGDWLRTMVEHAVRERVGAVGARLLYPDGTIQHAGVAIGIGGAAGHVQKGVTPDEPRFAQWHGRTRIVSAVTAACLVVERRKFDLAGGMDGAAFAIDFNDVDLCLKLAAQGLDNVLVVEATLVHRESQSRGTARSPEAAARFARELATLRTRWHTDDHRDPHHSPLFRAEAEQCLLAF